LAENTLKKAGFMTFFCDFFGLAGKISANQR